MNWGLAEFDEPIDDEWATFFLNNIKVKVSYYHNFSLCYNTFFTKILEPNATTFLNNADAYIIYVKELKQQELLQIFSVILKQQRQIVLITNKIPPLAFAKQINDLVHEAGIVFRVHILNSNNFLIHIFKQYGTQNFLNINTQEAQLLGLEDKLNKYLPILLQFCKSNDSVIVKKTITKNYASIALSQHQVFKASFNTISPSFKNSTVFFATGDKGCLQVIEEENAFYVYIKNQHNKEYYLKQTINKSEASAITQTFLFSQEEAIQKFALQAFDILQMALIKEQCLAT